MLSNEILNRFVLADVCKILGIGNSRDAKTRLDQDDVGTADTIDSLGRSQVVSIINESGLYDVILDSRKPEAKKFRRWITSDVIPSIRQHGGYLTLDKIQEALLNPDTLLQLAQELKKTNDEKAALEAERELNAPKVAVAEAMEASDDLITQKS